MSDEALGLLVGIITFVAVVILILVIIAAIVLTVAWHWFLAWLLLTLARSYPVRHWVIDHGLERVAIRFWLWILPGASALIWTGISYYLWSSAGLDQTSAAIFSLLGAWLLLHFYYGRYIGKMPKEADWVVFVGATHGMALERRLAYIEKSTRLKLWWVNLWS